MIRTLLAAAAVSLMAASDVMAQSMELNPDVARTARLDTWFEPASDLDRGGEVEFFQSRIASPVYGQRVGDWVLGLRAGYEFTSLDLPGDLLAESSLHRLELGPTAVYAPAGSPWRAFVLSSAGLATDFSSLDGEDVIYTAIAAVGYKFSDRFSLLAGGYYSQDFGDARLFPGIGFLWQVTDDWSVSLLPPRLRIAYTPNDSWRFALEAYPDGGGWSVESEDGQQALLERKSLRAGLRIERKIGDKSWAYLGAGWAFGREYRLEDENTGRLLFESDADDGAYLALGFNFGF